MMSTIMSPGVIYTDGRRSFHSPDGTGRIWAEAEAIDGVNELRDDTGIEEVLRVSDQRIHEMAGY